MVGGGKTPALKAWGVATIILLLASSVTALTVQLSADRTRVALGDVFAVTVAMSIDDGSAAPSPDLTLPDGFEVVGTRSSTSTSISIVNGAVTQTRTVNVVTTVRAGKEGRHTIGPASVVSNGKTFRSQAIQVEVVKGQARPRTSTSGGQSPVTGNQLEEIEQNLFIAAKADRKDVYVGEQILLSYDLYSRYRIQNPKFGAVPSYTGFWAETVFEANRLEQRAEVVNGRQFNKSRLKQVALFPTLPGQHKIEQLEFVCDIPVRSRRRSLFDADDFFSWDPFRSRQVTVRSEDIVFDVRSLPAGAPPSFSGGVGSFDVSAAVSATEVTQGDPITVTVVVSGEGNIHSVAEPTRPSSGDFRFYDPKATVETEVRGATIAGEKTFEYVAIPSVSGTVELPPFEMAHFDPVDERYVVTRTPPIVLNVAPAEEVASVSMTSPVGKSVELMGQDIRFIKADAERLTHQADYLHRSSLFWAFHALPALGLLGAWQWRRRQERLSGDVAYARKRRSRGEAQKRLDEARNLLEADSAAFHAEIHRTLSAFVADRLNLDVAGLTADQARRLLAERQVTPEIVAQVVEIIEACDYARFAPGAASASDRKSILDRTAALIDALEQAV